jgi:hypothetical protein
VGRSSHREIANVRERFWLPLIAVAALVPRVVSASTVDISAKHTVLRAAYAAQLNKLATWADGQGFAEEARYTRRWLPGPEPLRIMLACRPMACQPPANAAASMSGEWQARFTKLRHAQADALLALAEEAVAAGQASAAFRLLPEVLHENPDHPQARKILGYEEFGGRWLSAFEVAKARAGQVWDDRFGWLPADHVPRYEAGERFDGVRWLKAEDETRLRASPKRGWDIVTEHYNVHTTHSLQAGVRLATRLEQLYDAWQQLFAGFVANEARLARQFAGQAAMRSEPARHKVVYYRNRDEYVAALEKQEPDIAISTGFYLAAAKTAYFFDDGSKDDSNLYHEATHQLFSEVRRSVRDVGQQANFWIVEGIACYMESLANENGWHFLGGEDAVRLRDAEHRLAIDGFYVPLAELTGYGMERLKRDPKIAMLYSQSSGLTYFLMNYESGRYRDALVAYLAAIYQGRDRPGTLAELCGASDVKLDEQYRQFIKSLK